MTEKVKSTAPLILEKIKSAKKILIHCHPSPDPDSVCSALATMGAIRDLREQGVTNAEVDVIKGDSNIPKAFMHFPMASEIKSQNWGETDIASYDLFICQDSASIDRVTAKTEVDFPESMTVVNIDHHKSNTSFGHINLVDSTYAATSEILSDLYELWGVRLNEDISTNIMMGIYTDTGGLSYSMTTTNTIEAFAKHSRFAPKYTGYIHTMENSNAPDYLMYLGAAFSNINHFYDEKLALSIITNDKILAGGITEDTMSAVTIPDYLKSVIGWDIGISLVEAQPSKWRVSCRTRDSVKYDMSKIAGDLGGGGHRAAAGARVEGTREEVVKKVVDIVGKYI